MRLQTLHCTQVGYWGAPLQLDLSRHLTVVLGDNEAGKSTLRRALRALLFGPDKALAAPLTVASFDMGATMVLDSTTQTIHRKGRNFQAALSPDLADLLSETNAGRFASLFDLTHENLWPQEQDFLKADGALGSLMFGVRTGVSPARLQQARKRIDDALAQVNSGKKGNEGIPHCGKQFHEADQRYRQLAGFAENDSLNDQRQALDKKVGELDTKLRKLDEKSRRLSSLIEGAAELEQLNSDQRLKQAMVLEGQPLPVAQVASFSARLLRVEEFEEQFNAKHATLQEASADLGSAQESGGLHALVEQCDALRETVTLLAADMRTLDEQGRQHAQKSSELRRVLERLGAGVEEDPVMAARALLRPEPLAAQLRALAEAHVELQSRLQHTDDLLRAAQRTLDGIADVEESTDEIAVEALESALTYFEEAASAEREIDQLNKQQAEAIPALERHRAALGVAVDADRPDVLRPPSPDAAKQAEQRLAEAQQKLTAVRAQVKHHVDEEKALQRKLAEQRSKIGGVASVEDVARARALRDERLDTLCAALVTSKGQVPVTVTMAELVEELRTLVRQSDLLVDRRMEAGEALGELRAGELQAEQLSARVEESRQEKDAAMRALSHASEATSALWSFLSQAPDSAATWFAQYGAWRDASDAHQQRAAELRQLRDRLAVAYKDALGILDGTLPRLEEMGSAQAMQVEVQRELNTRNACTVRIEALRTQQQAARTEVTAAKDDATAVRDELEAWQAQWNESTRDLPAALERQPAAVVRWLALQEELRRTLEEIDRLADDRRQLSEAIADSQGRIRDLREAAVKLAPDMPLPEGLGPIAVFARLDEACKLSRSRHAERERLTRDRDRARREMASAREAWEKARSQLLNDWTDAGLVEPCSLEALETMQQRAAKFEKLNQDIAETEAVLRGRWGDEVPAASAELAENSVVVLEARLEDVASELKRTRDERETLANQRRDADRALEAMREVHDVNAAVQDRTDALEALFNKLEERYRLQLAKLILDQAYREASDGGQGIEEMASTYFVELTDGAYSGLRISDEDPSKPGLVAVESARNEKTLDELSAGTRDQIWLALRLAGIVAAARETPFPLLLDDSLVQFDDTRAKAALKLLHRISAQVQVILFTHHDHVADLARDVVPEADFGLVVLPGVSGAMRERAASKTTRQRYSRPVLEQSEEAVSIETGMIDDLVQPVPGHNANNVDEARGIILAVLDDASAPMGKAAILEAAMGKGYRIESVWLQAINSLLVDQAVKKEGEKKGTKYRVA